MEFPAPRTTAVKGPGARVTSRAASRLPWVQVKAPSRATAVLMVVAASSSPLAPLTAMAGTPQFKAVMAAPTVPE